LTGPHDEDRCQNCCFFWGETTKESGGKAATRHQTPDGNDLIVQTSLATVGRVKSSAVPPRFRTTARAFGLDFILEIAGVNRRDESTDLSPRPS